MRDIRESQENRRRHVAPVQPLGHLLTVDVDELEKRSQGRGSGKGKGVDKAEVVSNAIRAHFREIANRTIAEAKR